MVILFFFFFFVLRMCHLTSLECFNRRCVNTWWSIVVLRERRQCRKRKPVSTSSHLSKKTKSQKERSLSAIIWYLSVEKDEKTTTTTTTTRIAVIIFKMILIRSSLWSNQNSFLDNSSKVDFSSSSDIQIRIYTAGDVRLINERERGKANNRFDDDCRCLFCERIFFSSNEESDES